MTYFEAECMRQEMIVAMKFRELNPDGPKEAAKKYTADQWLECRKAILEKMEEDKKFLDGLLELVGMIKQGETP
jgi:hypothetical protein